MAMLEVNGTEWKLLNWLLINRILEVDQLDEVFPLHGIIS